MPKRPQMVNEAALSDLVDFVVSGYWEYDGITPFTLKTTGPDNEITVNVSALGATGKTLARDALEAWETVADITFREINGDAQISFTEQGSLAQVTFDPPDGKGPIVGTTVTIGPGWLNKYGTEIGSYSFQTYIHEIGHALGLGHSGEYKTDVPTYPGGLLFDEDSWQMSIMSYYGQDRTPLVDATRASVITPQVADILAIQELYGAADGSETRGDTIYGVGSNLKTYLGDYFREYYFEGSELPYAATYTLSDVGGIDTIDVSFHGKPQTVYLEPGAISSIVGQTGNLIIMPGTVIENYISGPGKDKIYGNDADNRLVSGFGSDRLYGGKGDDDLVGEEGDDFLFGGGGRDGLTGDAGEDLLKGGGGNDDLFGGAANDQVIGGGGHDLLSGEGGDDRMFGGAGVDELIGEAGNDLLNGGGGNDSINGGGGDDNLVGGNGNDLMFGELGSDVMTGGNGGDRMLGEGGHDTMSGDNGKDVLIGDLGDDVLSGGKGRDTVDGGLGHDVLDGGGGKDRIIAGSGDDEMSGGGGRDVFVFTIGHDVITDFSSLDKVLFSNDLSRNDELSVAGIMSHAEKVRGDIVVEFGKRAVLTLEGFNDLEVLADRIDIL